MKSLKFFALMMLMTMIAGSAIAGSCSSTCGDESSISVSGQARYRINTDGFDFDSDTPLNFFSEMRTRINVKAKANDKAGVFFQAQDSRTVADFPGWDFTNKDLFMQQGYLWYAPCENGWFKMGRMAVGLHNERLIGKVDWHNVGRTFEGFMAGRKLGDKAKLTAFAFQACETNDLNLDADGDPYGDPMVYGLNVNLPEQQVDVFAYLISDKANNEGWGGDVDFSLMTFGAYSKRAFGPSLWYEAMFAMQTGSDDSFDYSGMLVNAQLGKKFDNGLYLGALLDYTTGDDDMADTDVKGFNNLFYTGHKFRGFMDLFLGTENHGLMDLGLRAKYPVNDSWTIKGDAHMFSNVEERNSGETAIGNEIDLTAVYSDGPFSWTTGFSMFMVDENYATDQGMAKDDAQNWF